MRVTWSIVSEPRVGEAVVRGRVEGGNTRLDEPVTANFRIRSASFQCTPCHVRAIVTVVSQLGV